MRIDAATIAMVLVVAAFCFWGAGYYTVFDDEAFSTQRYALPLRDLVPALWRGAEPDPPLYYVVEHMSISTIGVRPVALRSLSIFCFLVGLLIARVAAAVWFNGHAARWAVALIAFNPLHLFFGFAARWYSMMFLWSIVLLWATGMILLRRGGRAWMGGWLCAAVAACYTNYFAVCLVGLFWLYGFLRHAGHRRAWGWMLGILIVAYVPWAPPFIAELRRFPHVEGGLQPYAVHAGRTLMALITGNLAGPNAWYVWAPLLVFAIALVPLIVRDARRLSIFLWVGTGCLVAGIATLTLIDKYAMSFSGLVWVAVGAVLAARRHGRWQRVRTAAVVGLCLGWAGCGINWIMEDGWSSLRWLDPIRKVVRDHLYDTLVATHPSIRYYYGTMDPADWYSHVGPAQWASRAAGVLSPEQMTAILLAGGEFPATRPVCTVRTASLRDADAAWNDLTTTLVRAGFRAGQPAYFLDDPWAALKDRLDSGYRHPAHRVEVQVYAPPGADRPGMQ